MTPEEFGSLTDYLQAAGAAAIIAEKRAIRHLQAALTRARVDLDKVRQRHRPVVKSDDDGNEVNCCLECDGLREDINENAAPVLWPCPTARDLDDGTTTETTTEAA